MFSGIKNANIWIETPLRYNKFSDMHWGSQSLQLPFHACPSVLQSLAKMELFLPPFWGSRASLKHDWSFKISFFHIENDILIYKTKIIRNFDNKFNMKRDFQWMNASATFTHPKINRQP